MMLPLISLLRYVKNLFNDIASAFDHLMVHVLHYLYIIYVAIANCGNYTTVYIHSYVATYIWILAT